ncbi:MAG: hypothetical protein WAN35_18230 [Terracidiphilus sp.]
MMNPTVNSIVKIFAPSIKSGFEFLEVAGANGRVEVMAPGSWRFRPQVAQSHAMGSTSQPHSAQ